MSKPDFGSVATGTWATSTATSAAVDVSHLRDLKVMLGGTFVGTWVVDISWDGTTFVPWEAGRTTPGVYTTIPACKAFKMRCSAFTSGTAVVGYAGIRD